MADPLVPKAKSRGFPKVKAKAKAKNYGSTAVLPPPQQQFMICLNNLVTMEVVERSSVMEIITDVEMGNVYDVNGKNKQGEEKIRLFEIVEETSCCSRQMKKCCNDCAPWNVSIWYGEQGGSPVKSMKMERPCTCTCCCINRPVVEITNSMSDAKIGSIADPCNCCDMTFTVYDRSDEAALYAKGGCCQPGLMCQCPCGPCAEVNFSVEDARSGVQVGNIKKTIGCNFLLGGDADKYELNFGKVTNYEYRALLMALSVFIDFRYFTTKEAKK